MKKGKIKNWINENADKFINAAIGASVMIVGYKTGVWITKAKFASGLSNAYDKGIFKIFDLAGNEINMNEADAAQRINELSAGLNS